MYVGGTANDTVYQYTLSTGWDLSTASYASKSLSVSSQDATLTGFCFNSDGTKLFASGTVSDSIYQYNLSTAYDVSTGSYASKSLDVSSEETNPRDVFLADDDKTLYVVAAATQDAVLKYVMTTANDLSTAYYTGDQLDLSGEQILAQAFFMRADKKVGYTVDSFTVDTVFQYDLAQYPTSSPVTFTGLTNGTSYTFNVWAINPFGWSTASDASGSVSPAQPIGLGQGGDYQHLNKINIATTGNATLFGNLGYGRISAAAFASSTRGVFAGGYSSGHHNTIAYVTFTTEGDATDFGDLTVARGYTSGCSSDTRGLINGGNETNVIDYVTIASVGNATDFGDLLVVQNQTGSLSSTIRAVVKQGDQDGFTRSNVMEYYTIASTGNSADFGDATVVSRDTCGLSGSTRGIFAGGNDDSTYYDVIQYITIASTGNATDFGDLSAQRSAAGACSSKTRGVIMGGKSNTNSDVDIIEYVTIDTLGNATDFGDLYIPGGQFCATSNVHGGLS
jgi:hypothetical protein